MGLLNTGIMERQRVKNLIKANILIGFITVIAVIYVISNFKFYLAHALFIAIISMALGMSFAATMFLWVTGITKN